MGMQRKEAVGMCDEQRTKEGVTKIMNREPRRV
jgi:hypothetical protein